MTPDRLLDLVGQPGGPLADAALWHLTVLTADQRTPAMRRIVFGAPGLDSLHYSAGQDLMLRVPQGGQQVVNRRYTIRSSDPERGTVTVDVSLHGTGPGTDWIRAAESGSIIEAIGPRGKITLRDGVDWHLFVADETGLPGALAMMEALPEGVAAVARLEVHAAEEEQEPSGLAAAPVDVQWLHRLGLHQPGDPELLSDAVATVTFPPGRGHAYVAAEVRVVRAVQRGLLARGLAGDTISTKAYWRRGLPNAPHGEPTSD
jgi:NADPH-dependent ferric siderophore reductase